jgi:pimeloyl-ACP methyl ester carboxylesterase
MKKQEKKKGLVKHILRITAIVLAAVIALPFIFVFAVRGVYAIKLNIRDSLQERIFVTLGGIEQVVHIRTKKTDNPVIIWLHGGPGWSNAYELAPWQYKMENDYTFVNWDQRGSGRTYRRNPDALPTLDILISDLDDLVDYTKMRFNQPVFIVGISWGSEFGITYASRHPEKIAGFVGVSQVINQSENIRIAVETACERAMAAGNTGDAEEMRAVYERNRLKRLSEINSYDYILIQALPTKYFVPRNENQAFNFTFSPWIGLYEITQIITVFNVNNDLFKDRNKQLFYEMDVFVPPERLEVPVAFIMGSEDSITVASSVVDYYHRVEAPSKNMFIIEGAGHSPGSSYPDEFAEKLREVLSGFLK